MFGGRGGGGVIEQESGKCFFFCFFLNNLAGRVVSIERSLMR